MSWYNDVLMRWYDRTLVRDKTITVTNKAEETMITLSQPSDVIQNK
jgi:hypothetical protein